MKSLRMLAATGLLAASTSLAGAGDTRVLVAYLDGGNEIPVAADSDAFGIATITLIASNALCYSYVVQNAGPANAAHIHAGEAGVAGLPVVTLPINALVPARNAGCVAVAAATITDLRNNPQRFYVNVHTAAFGGGAVRGQLQAE